MLFKNKQVFDKLRKSENEFDSLNQPVSLLHFFVCLFFVVFFFEKEL